MGEMIDRVVDEMLLNARIRDLEATNEAQGVELEALKRGRGDAQEHYERWRKKLLSTFDNFTTVDQIVEPIMDQLYEATKEDWSLAINWCLTEPTCPIVVIRSDDDPEKTCGGHFGDTVEEALRASVKAITEKYIEQALEAP